MAARFMTLERCKELQQECYDDLQRAKLLGESGWVTALTNRKASLEVLRRKIESHTSPFSRPYERA